jgi:tape measure domain-containing protein
MAGTPNLRVRISADLADIKSGLGVLRGELAKVKRQSDISFGNQNALVNGLRQARQQLVGFVGAYLSLRGARVLGGIADEAKLLRGRIREAKGDYEAILALAQRTRSGLTGTVDLYARLERSTRTQGVNQARLLALTEATNQAVQLSFATTASGEAALFQLGQGLSAGILRGEELNSVMEQTPRLAEAIQAGLLELGVKGAGDLRKLAKEGELTTERVIAALETQQQALAEEFARLPVTIAGAMTQIRNAFVDYVGDVDEATGASKRLAETLQQVAADLPRYLDGLLFAIRTLIENLDVLIVYLGTRLASGAISAAIVGFIRLRTIIASVTAATFTLRTALLGLGGPVGIAIAALAAGIYYLYKRTNEARQAKELLNQRLAENEKLARASAQAALADAANQRKNALETLGNARAQLELKRARLANEIGSLSSVGAAKDSTGFRLGRMGRGVQQAQGRVDEAMRQVDAWSDQVAKLTVQVAMGWREASNAAAAAGKATADAGEDGKKKVQGMVDALELLQDAARRALAELERRFEANELGITEFFARKRDAELAAIDLAIRQAQEEARVAKTSEQQSKALTEIIKLQRDRAEIGPRVAREQAAAERELADALGQVKIRLLEAEGETARARSAQLAAEFEELILKLEASGDAAGVALVRKLINIEAAKAQLQQFQTVMQDAMAQLRNAETSIASQQQAGLLGVSEAERQIDAERQKALETLRQLRESVMAYYEATKDPTVIPFLQELNGNIGAVAASQQQLRQQIADQAINSVTNLFTDLATGAKSAKDALRDFVLSFVQGMAQIAARALATFLVLRALDALYPGLGKATAATMGAGQVHGGGIAGAGGSWRRLNPMLLGAAPRYHAGGIAGLAPNEVPAVLERGEEVLTRTDPRHRNNLRGSGQRPTRMIFVDDQRRVADFLNTPEGEDAVVEILGRNPGRVREILA